jgi:hypothetical protein
MIVVMIVAVMKGRRAVVICAKNFSALWRWIDRRSARLSGITSVRYAYSLCRRA